MLLHRSILAPLLIIAVAAGSVRCTTMKTVRPGTDPSKPVFGNVKAGDTVVLQLRDGRRVEITVARVEREAVVSAEGVRYPHGDIAELQRRSFSGLKTLGFAGAASLAAAAAVAVALAVLWGS